MSTNEQRPPWLLRISAAAGCLGGALTIIYWWIHPPAEETAKALLPSWQIMSTLFIPLVICLQLGLTGLVVRSGSRLPTPGRVGFLLAFAGLGCYVGVGTFDAFLVPYLLQELQPELVAMSGPLLSGALGTFFKVTGLVFSAGYILLSIGLIRAGEGPRWALWAWIPSAPILGFSPLVPHWLRIVGCGIFGLAHVVLGYDLWRDGRSEERRDRQGSSMDP